MHLVSPALATAVLTLAACSSTGDTADLLPDAESAAPAAETASEEETPAADDSGEPIDAGDTDAATGTDDAALDIDVYFTDTGVGCGVYVSVAEGDATNGLPASTIMAGLISDGFDRCSFSEVTELGLVTVTALDSYGQPDWGDVIGHAYFAVEDWPAITSACPALPLTTTCLDALAANLAES